MAEQLIQLDLAEHRAQRRLRQLRGLVNIVGYLDGRVVGVDHIERNHSVHLDGDVVAGNHVLSWNLEHVLSQRDANHRLHRPEDKDDAWPVWRWRNATQGEDHTALVLAENLDAVEHVENENGQNDCKRS